MRIDKKQLQPDRLAAILALLIVPAMAFILMEFYRRNPFAEIRTKALWFNIFLFELIGWLFFFVIGSVRFALRLELVLAMIYGIADTYVVKFRTNPIVPWDIYSLKTAASVANNYDMTPDLRMIVVTILFVTLFAGLHFVKWKLPLFPINKKVLLQRLLPVLALALALNSFVGKLQDEEFQTKNYLYPFLFTPAHMTKVNGMAVTFAMNLAYMSIDVPKGYEKEEAEALLSGYESSDTAGNSAANERPNIIVIMDEAFSDMASVGEFQASEDYMPFVHKLQNGEENTITGNLQVSVCGGNTANSEFEFLTGNTMAFLPQGSIPYQQYITKELPAIPAYLKSLGYQTIATHPYYASGWERDEIYPLLGFERSIFIDEYEKTNKLRSYISDDACVDKIIELYEAKEEDTPLFVFQVTMQNHGGYTEEYTNFKPDITVDGIDNISVEQYLSLIKRSDAALEKLVSYFAEQEEKTLIVFFGDHQPNDAVAGPLLKLNGKRAADLTEEELQMRYEVPYVIWANYDIEETEADTSLNYLGARVLELADIPLPAYQSFLMELSKTYPIVSAMQVQKADGTKGGVKDEKEGLLDYQKLQYYQLFEE